MVLWVLIIAYQQKQKLFIYNYKSIKNFGRAGHTKRTLSPPSDRECRLIKLIQNYYWTTKWILIIYPLTIQTKQRLIGKLIKSKAINGSMVMMRKLNCYFSSNMIGGTISIMDTFRRVIYPNNSGVKNEMVKCLGKC